jgi:hypothetical protein
MSNTECPMLNNKGTSTLDIGHSVFDIYFSTFFQCDNVTGLLKYHGCIIDAPLLPMILRKAFKCRAGAISGLGKKNRAPVLREPCLVSC